MKSFHFLLVWMLGYMVICCSGPSTPLPSPEAGTFSRIRYQNKDIHPFLGVGLWAWPLPMDYDRDGDMDILVNSKNAAWFENIGQTEDSVSFTFRGDIATKKLAGHTTSPTTVDWDGDGKRELLLGAEDGYLYFFPNSQKH